MSPKENQLLYEILTEMRNDIRTLRDDVNTLKTQRRMIVWLSGVVGSVITFFFTHAPQWLMNANN